MRQKAELQNSLDLRISCEVARQIRQHARGSSKAEVCGVLIGTEDGGVTSVEASIPGAKAVQGGSHVTFTQDTWEHIYQIKDRDYPNARIVGWYHSHPGFGVFLSDHDTFIHKNFFSSARQVAWVYDPHSDEEGCFGWVGEKLERLPRIVFVDKKGGEGAGETGKPEPLLFDSEDEEFESDVRTVPSIKNPEARAMLNAAVSVLSYLCVAMIGFLICWILFPHFVLVQTDPRTGQPMLEAPSGFSMGSGSGGDASKRAQPATQQPGQPGAQPANAMPQPQNSKGRP